MYLFSSSISAKPSLKQEEVDDTNTVQSIDHNSQGKTLFFFHGCFLADVELHV